MINLSIKIVKKFNYDFFFKITNFIKLSVNIIKTFFFYFLLKTYNLKKYSRDQIIKKDISKI